MHGFITLSNATSYDKGLHKASNLEVLKLHDWNIVESDILISTQSI